MVRARVLYLYTFPYTFPYTLPLIGLAVACCREHNGLAIRPTATVDARSMWDATCHRFANRVTIAITSARAGFDVNTRSTTWHTTLMEAAVLSSLAPHCARWRASTMFGAARRYERYGTVRCEPYRPPRLGRRGTKDSPGGRGLDHFGGDSRWPMVQQSHLVPWWMVRPTHGLSG